MNQPLFQVREGATEISSHQHAWQAGAVCYENQGGRKVYETFLDGRPEREFTGECLKAFKEHPTFQAF